MEEIKIFATEISGIGITKYKDPVTEKEVEVEYKLTTGINPGKDVDVPGVDVENILKDSLTREINNDLNKRKLLSIRYGMILIMNKENVLHLLPLF